MEIDVDMKTTAAAPTYSIKLQQLQNTLSAYQLSSALTPSLSGVLSSLELLHIYFMVHLKTSA